MVVFLPAMHIYRTFIICVLIHVDVTMADLCEQRVCMIRNTLGGEIEEVEEEI